MDHPTKRLDSTPDPAAPEQPTRRLQPVRRASGRPLCLRCEQPMIRSRVVALSNQLMAASQDLEVQVRNGENLIGIAKYRRSSCAAWVCTDCGYLELRATMPANLAAQP